MKRALISAIVAVVALSSVTGSEAMAQARSQNHDAPPHARHDRGEANRYDRDNQRNQRHWRAGDRLPHEYRAKRYVIAKPAAYRLHRPGRGHQWVRAGSDALLVITGTGVVVKLVPGLFR